MTPDEMQALLAERWQKIRNALDTLRQREQDLTAEKARLTKLLDRLDELKSLIAPKPTGRPPTWKGPIGCATVEVVEARRQQGASIIDALRWLRTVPLWGQWWTDLSDEELQSRYSEAAKYWQPVFKEMNEIESALAESGLDSSPLPDVQRLIREG